MSLVYTVRRLFFWTKDILLGGLLLRQYKFVSNLVNHRDNTIVHRRRQLSNILHYAKEHTVFYGEVTGEHLSDFPVITKESILSRFDDFRVPIESIPGQKGQLHIHRTSGSTGTPFHTYQDTNSWIRRVALIKVSNTINGFHSFIPLLHLRSLKHYCSWGNEVPEFLWRKDLGILYADNAAMNTEMLGRLVVEMKHRKIRFIRGYVTSVDILSEFIVNQGIQFEYPLFVIAGGEKMMETLRKRIVNVLHWNIISQYANEENGLLGQSVMNEPADVIDLYLANCYVEVLKMDCDDPVAANELGRVVVTDYTNHAMPLIRYDTGDLAMVAAKTEDGEVTALKNLGGRKTQILYKTNGEAIDFFNCISPEIFNNQLIRQWQFVQEGERLYELNLCGEKQELSPLIPHFVDLLKQLLGEDAGILVNISEFIPVLSSGKRQIVIQNYQPKIQLTISKVR